MDCNRVRRVYTDDWLERWWSRNIKTCKAKGTSVSELIRKIVKKDDGYPINIAELWDRTRRNNGTEDYSCLTRDEANFICMLYEEDVLERLYNGVVNHHGSYADYRKIKCDAHMLPLENYSDV